MSQQRGDRSHYNKRRRCPELSFLQESRADPVEAKVILSAATLVTPFRDVSGNPSTSVGDLTCVLDYIAIMGEGRLPDLGWKPSLDVRYHYDTCSQTVGGLLTCFRFST